jgi:hypothetical protein
MIPERRNQVEQQFMHEAMFLVGTPVTIPSGSPDNRHGAFFEDDGDSGYFYALDLSRPEDRVVDAVHIYNVENVVDRYRPSLVNILWSEDGSKCALLINNYPHAVFDFSAKRGYCRTNFPNFEESADERWRKSDHSWSDEAISWLGLSSSS